MDHLHGTPLSFEVELGQGSLSDFLGKRPIKRPTVHVHVQTCKMLV